LLAICNCVYSIYAVNKYVHRIKGLIMHLTYKEIFNPFTALFLSSDEVLICPHLTVIFKVLHVYVRSGAFLVIEYKFSWAISQAKWLNGEETNVLKTISVLVLRVLVTDVLWCDS